MFQSKMELHLSVQNARSLLVCARGVSCSKEGISTGRIIVERCKE